MELTDVQLILAGIIVTVILLFTLFDHWGKQRIDQRSQRIKTPRVAGPRRSVIMFDSTPIEYLTAQKLAAERPIDPLHAAAIVSKVPVIQLTPRETLTIQMTPPASQKTGPSDGPPSPPGTDSLPAITIDAALWERLVASTPKQDLLTAVDARTDPVRSDPEPALSINNGSPTAWPTGMIQHAAFEKLLDGGRPFSGLVVSIGINDAGSSMWHSQSLINRSAATSLGCFARTISLAAPPTTNSSGCVVTSRARRRSGA